MISSCAPSTFCVILSCLASFYYLALIRDMYNRTNDARRMQRVMARDKPCPFAHFCARLPSVNGREFVARVRKLARGNGIAVRFDRTRGKGSHGTLYDGDRHTVVKDRGKPLKTGTFLGMCKQLGIDPDDLSGVAIMATRYSYPIDLHEEREGGYSVTFPDTVTVCPS